MEPEDSLPLGHKHAILPYPGMFPQKQVIYSTQEKNRKENAVSPTEESPLGEGSYFHDMRPVLVTFRLMGLLPFRSKSSGQTTVKKICPITLYSILVQGAMAAAGVLVSTNRMKYICKENLNFSEILVELTFAASFVPLLLSPFTQLPEAGKKAVCLNNWGKLQRCYLALSGKSLNLKQRHYVKMTLVVTFLISAVVTTFPFFTLKEIEYWYGIPFSYIVFISLLNTAMWRVNGASLIRCAKILATDLEQLLSDGENIYIDKIGDYRWLWLQLSKLTQAKGTAMGFTYGTQLIGYFFEQVLAVYGILIYYRDGNKINLLVCAGSVFIFTGLIFVTCNTAQRATEEVGTNLKEKLQQLFHQIPVHSTEARQETRLFIQTILENPPLVNLSGFVVVNRGLQTSLMSAMVTYLVVLIQFQLSTANGTVTDNCVISTNTVDPIQSDG